MISNIEKLKFPVLVLLILVLVSTFGEQKASAVNPESDFTYTINSTTNEVTITGYKGTTTDVVIPQTIEGKPVTFIGTNSFSSKNLTTLVLPEGLKRINDSAFSHNKLTNVTLPTTLTHINSFAFYANSLTDIVIPKSVTDIGSSSFAVNQFTEINIKKDITYGDYVYWSNKITKATIEDGTSVISNNILSDNLLTEINIPRSVTKIGKYAFNNNEILKVDLHEYIYEIGELAFANNRIKEIRLPYSLIFINNNRFATKKVPASEITMYAYDNLTGAESAAKFEGYKFVSLGPKFELTKPNVPTDFKYTKTATEITITEFNSRRQVWIPDTIEGIPVTKIGNSAFKSKELDYVKLPSTIQIIWIGGFSFNNLKEIEFPEGLITISDSAFTHNKIEKLKLPSTLTTLDERSFEYNSLTEITIPSSLKKIGNMAFQNNKLKKVVLENGVEDTGYSSFASNEIDTVILPETVKWINNYSFANNKIREIKIPKSIEIIWNYAFDNNLIEKVIIPEGVREIRANAFNKNEIKEIDIPKSITNIPNNILSNSRVTDPYSVIVVGYETPPATKNFATTNGHRFVSIDNPKFDDPDTSRGKLKWSEVDILAGELSFEAPNIGLFNDIKLNAQIQKAYANLLGNLKVKDGRGSAEGWRVIVEATPFKTTIGGVEYSLPVGRLNLKKPTTVKEETTGAIEGLSSPITTSIVPIDGMGPVSVAVASAGYGKGSTEIEFDLTGTLELSILPEEVITDKTTKNAKYVSTLTWSLTEAP